MEELLNIKAVAKITNLSQANIYKLIKQDAFPTARKVGGANRWRRADLDEWICNLPKNGIAKKADPVKISSPIVNVEVEQTVQIIE